MMQKLFTAFIVTTISLYLISCDISDKPAHGLEDEIFVVADSVEYEELKDALETTFEKLIYTPQPEKLFILKRVPIERLESNKNKKNLIIIAPLKSNSTTAQFIKAVIDTSIENQIMDGEVFVVEKYDLWARDQLVMVLTAPTYEQLEFKILQNSDKLLYPFQKISDKRLYSSLYSDRYEQKKIEGRLLKKYGWVIYVQGDVAIGINNPENKFVWFRRSPYNDMERWIFVHWIDNASPQYLNEDSIRTIRNRMTKMFYRTPDDSAYAVIEEDYYMTSEINFNGRPALFTQGLWDLNIKGKGGPFINYTFYDEKTKRIYMLDGSVFAQQYYKRNLIQQMDVTLQSFMTTDELSKDRKEELIEAAEE